MSPPEERATSLSELVYRALLRIYPKCFRESYGPQMIRAFRDLHRAALEKGGPAALPGLWARMLIDLGQSAVTERREAGVMRSSVKDPGLAAFLSFLWVGLGQVYNGQGTKGLALVTSGAVWMFVFFSGLANTGNSVAVYALLTVVSLSIQSWSMWDAYKSAKRIGTAVRLG